MCVSLLRLLLLNEHFAVDKQPRTALSLEKYLMSLRFFGIMWSLRNLNSHFNMVSTNSSESRACCESGSLTYENKVLEHFSSAEDKPKGISPSKKDACVREAAEDLISQHFKSILQCFISNGFVPSAPLHSNTHLILSRPSFPAISFMSIDKDIRV